jgi:hypothetical protein
MALKNFVVLNKQDNTTINEDYKKHTQLEEQATRVLVIYLM